MEKRTIPAALVLMTAVLGVGAYRAGARERAVDKSETAAPPRPVGEPACPHQKAPDGNFIAQYYAHAWDTDLGEKQPPKPQSAAFFKGQLPGGAAPIQALAVISKDGTLLLYRKVVYYQPVTANGGIGPITSYKQMQYDLVSSYEVDAVDVSSIKGDKVEKKELRERLRKETLILVSADGRPVDPLQLRLYKEDTLVFVLPTPTGRVVASDASVPSPPAVSPAPPVAVPRP